MPGVNCALTAIFVMLQARLTNEKGATAVEYGLIVTFIALVMVIGATALGTSLKDMFKGIADTVAPK